MLMFHYPEVFNLLLFVNISQHIKQLTFIIVIHIITTVYDQKNR
jgi:hypothetical protein